MTPREKLLAALRELAAMGGLVGWEVGEQASKWAAHARVAERYDDGHEGLYQAERAVLAAVDEVVAAERAPDPRAGYMVASTEWDGRVHGVGPMTHNQALAYVKVHGGRVATLSLPVSLPSGDAEMEEAGQITLGDATGNP